MALQNRDAHSHQTADSPGLKGGPTTAPTEYPKILYGPAGKDGTHPTLTVADPGEETAATASKKWKKSPAAWLVFLVACLLGFGSAVSAQTFASHPTLSAAMAAPAQGSPANSITLSALTGLPANGCIWVGAELIRINALPTSGTTLTNVVRGERGSVVSAHPSAAQAIVGACAGTYFVDYPPTSSWQSCTRSAQTYIPTVVVPRAQIWVCAPGGAWNVTSPYPSVNGNSTQYAQHVLPNLGDQLAAKVTTTFEGLLARLGW